MGKQQLSNDQIDYTKLSLTDPIEGVLRQGRRCARRWHAMEQTVTTREGQTIKRI